MTIVVKSGENLMIVESDRNEVSVSMKVDLQFIKLCYTKGGGPQNIGGMGRTTLLHNGNIASY